MMGIVTRVGLSPSDSARPYGMFESLEAPSRSCNCCSRTWIHWALGRHTLLDVFVCKKVLQRLAGPLCCVAVTSL